MQREEELQNILEENEEELVQEDDVQLWCHCQEPEYGYSFLIDLTHKLLALILVI